MAEKVKGLMLQIVILSSLVGMFIMTGKFLYLGLAGLLVALHVLFFLASKYPNAKWVEILYGYRWPRTDVVSMPKKDLVKSGFQFLIYSCPILILSIILVYIVNHFFNDNFFIFGIIWVLIVLFMIFFISGIYLLFRGILKN